MKNSKLKIASIVLAILLVSILSFCGIYVKKNNIYINALKDFNYSKEMSETKLVTLTVSDDTYNVVKDSEGNIVDSSDLTEEEKEEKGYVTETIEYNNDDVKNSTNYIESKKVLEKRLKDSGFEDFEIRVDEETGDINIELKNEMSTTQDLGAVLGQGKFEFRDATTGEVLLDNNQIKKVTAKTYNDSTTIGSNSYVVYLDFTFTKEGKQKLKEITTNYLKGNGQATQTEEETQVESGETETESESEVEDKEVAIYLDNTKLMSSTFDDISEDGVFNLTYGNSTSDTQTLKSNISNASKTAILLSDGVMPVKYEVKTNIDVETKVSKETLKIILTIIAVIVLIGLIYLMIKYRVLGILSSIGYVGFVAIYLLVLRYTNANISISAMFAMTLMLIINYILNLNILRKVNSVDTNVKKPKDEVENTINKVNLSGLINSIPVMCLCIILVFMKNTVFNSFGIALFWGMVVMYLYNYLIAFRLIKIEKLERIGGK